MRIFNADKTQELLTYDLEKGYLKKDKIFIAHNEAVEGVAETGHYKTIAVYENGGKDVEWVVDTPAVEAKEAYDEYEDIQVYIEYTYKELSRREIIDLKNKLARTDYKAIKYAEGVLNDEDYYETKNLRQNYRLRINELERILNDDNNTNL